MAFSNTYTRLDTENLIEFGRQAPGKDQREAQMILNHKAAIEMVVSSVEEIDRRFSAPEVAAPTWV